LAEDARYSIMSRRFSLIADMSATERAIISRLDHAPRRIHQAGCELASEQEVAPPPMFIVSGWACRVRVTPSGHRQILGFLLPGDGVCLRGAAEHVSAFNICALTQVETIDATSFLKMGAQPQVYPGIALAIEGAKLQGEIFTANQIVRLGLQTKAERLANLLLELRWRLEQTGLAEGSTFPMPLTRETLGDALGMSASRINWVLRWLKARNMLSVRYGRGDILSSTAVDNLAGFKAPEERLSAPRSSASLSSAG
jgi:CRP-like cAMP-binding protein